MLSNISKGGKMTALALVAVAIVAGALGATDEYSHGDGEDNYLFAAGSLLLAFLVAVADNYKHTTRKAKGL